MTDDNDMDDVQEFLNQVIGDVVESMQAEGQSIQLINASQLGEYPPEVRKAAHTLQSIHSMIELTQALNEISVDWLIKGIREAGGAGGLVDGSMTIDMTALCDEVVKDPRLVELFEQSSHGIRRDMIVSRAQLLEIIRRRHDVPVGEITEHLPQNSGPGIAWALAYAQMEDAVRAGRDFEDEKFLSDGGPEMPPLESCPTAQLIDAIVRDERNTPEALLHGAAALNMIASILEINSTDRWEEFLSHD